MHALLHPLSASFVGPSLYSAAYPFYRSHILRRLHRVELLALSRGQYQAISIQASPKCYEPRFSGLVQSDLKRPLSTLASVPRCQSGRLRLRLPELHSIGFHRREMTRSYRSRRCLIVRAGTDPLRKRHLSVLVASADCLRWQLLTRVQKAEDFLSSKDGPFWSETRE
jgi:hypothetical protein